MFSSSASQVVSATQAEAIDFDGTNDYLSRLNSTDIFEMTCSLWFYVPSGTQPLFARTFTSGFHGLTVSASASALVINIYNSNGGQTQVASQSYPLSGSTFYHVVFSGSLTSAGSLKCYINDVAQSDIALSADGLGANDAYFVARFPNTGVNGKTRLSHVYFKNNSIDLSVTANRRLFITADLKPAAGQAALNPIIYLPMSDPTAPGTNAGTGGNFTLTGTVARSGRGPNQYNAPYSDLNGSTQYLSRTTAPTGIADGKQFTFSCVFNGDVFEKFLICFDLNAGAAYFGAWVTSGKLNIIARNSAGTFILNYTSNTTFVAGRNYQVVVSVDLTSTSNRYVAINGSIDVGSWSTYTNDTIAFTARNNYFVGARVTGSAYFNGRLGNVWFNTSYIDLSVAANLAKFVTGTGIDAKPVDLGASGELPTGTSPLIYLPMYGNNAGKNYGTGGDFTVNSAPYTGARGPNEFWGNKATFDGVVSNLRRTSAIVGISDTKTITCSFWVNPGVISGGESWLYMSNSGVLRGFRISFANSFLRFFAYNSSGATILSADCGTAYGAGSIYFVQLSIDLANTSNRSIYINGSLDSTTWTTYTNSTISFTTANDVWIGGDGSLYPPGTLSELYLSTDYIDFSQEANRLKFRDAFGNPTDLPSAITAGTVPNPAIYMRFDPASFGTNSGTGGNFTVNGTITDGGQL